MLWPVGGIRSGADRYRGQAAMEGHSNDSPVPTPMTRTALDILKTVYGYDAFRGPQARIVAHVIEGNHAFVLMPTGGGKSLCYQIPALARPGMGLVVSPLLALMADQVAALRQAGVKAAALNSDLSPDERQRWVDGLPDLAGEWVESVEARGLPGRAFLEAYMNGLRDRGEEPVRDWDGAE